MKALRVSVLVAATVTTAAPIAAQDALDWSPTAYAGLSQTLESSADMEEQALYALTVDSHDFATTIADGYAAFLVDTRRTILAGAPDHVQDAFVRHEFFRDQTVTVDSDTEGGGRPATYRSAQIAYLVNCADRLVASNGYTLFARNNTDGRAVFFEEGTTIMGELVAEEPEPGSAGEAVISAVCDGKFIYQPES